MKQNYIYDAAHVRALPEFTRGIEWIRTPTEMRITRLVAHAEAHPDHLPVKMEIKRLRKRVEEEARQQA